MRSKTILGITSIFGLVAIGTAQGAAPPPGGGLPPKYAPHFSAGGADPNAVSNVSCASEPTLELCNNTTYQACDDFVTKCTSVVDAAGTAYAAQTSATCLMDATGDNCVPTQSRPYSTTLVKNPGTSWMAQEAAAARDARAALESSHARFVPATYTRNVDWSNKSKPINSCEAYVYAKYYDYERFLDATYACGGNDQCVFDSTFLGYTTAEGAKSPGIAKHTLRDRDGAIIVPSASNTEATDAAFLLNGGSDVLPKNPFYASAAFIPPAVFDALKTASGADPSMVAKLAQLQTQLAKGYKFYNYGNAEGLAVEYTSNAWDWHVAMNNRVKPKAYPQNQQIEFMRRNERVAADVWAVGSALACTSLSVPCVALPLEVARVTPGMAQSYPADPFAIGSILTKNDKFSVGLQAAFESALVPSQIPSSGLNVNMGAAGIVPIGKVSGAKSPPLQKPGSGGISNTPIDLRPTWDGFDPTYWTKVDFAAQDQLQYASYTLQQRWLATRPIVQMYEGRQATYPRLDCSQIQSDLDPILAASCTLTNTVLDEWSRTLNGRESCLDMKGYACDWSPMAFRESFLGSQKMQGSREFDYKECLRFTHNDFEKKGIPALSTAVPLAAQWKWTDVKADIEKKRGDAEAFLAIVPSIKEPDASRFGKAMGTVLGDHTIDQQQWGNDIFGAGYRYDIGWDAAVLARDPQNQQIQRMQLGFNGDFEAHVSAFNNDISLIEVDLGAKVNENDSGEVDAKHYLYIIGFGTFDKLDQKDYAKVADISQSFELADAHDDFEQNVFDAGFWVGPVYVHVGVDVEFFFDAPLLGTVDLPKNNLAPVAGSLIEATLTFHPKAGVSADLYAYGGWGPIAEVGVEAQLNLITVGLPMKSSIGVSAIKKGSGPDELSLHIKEGINVSISTLSGEIDLCGKIIGIGGCAKMVSWKGLETTFPLFTPVEQEFALASLNF